jgi:hypothetical protein
MPRKPKKTIDSPPRSQIAERECVIAIGRTGCGKTSYLLERLRARMAELAHRKPVVLIHDERAVSWDGKLEPKSIGGGAGTVPFPTASKLMEHVRENRSWPRVACIYEQPPTALFAIAWKRAKTSGAATIVVIDELDKLPSRLPERGAVYNCLHYGRPYPIDIFGSSREPQRVSPSWFSLASRAALFQCQGVHTLTAVKKAGWVFADELASKLPSLPPHVYYEVRP